MLTDLVLPGVDGIESAPFKQIMRGRDIALPTETFSNVEAVSWR
jgi:hypothetical protein